MQIMSHRLKKNVSNFHYLNGFKTSFKKLYLKVEDAINALKPIGFLYVDLRRNSA